jgi:hypothetical protein
MTESKSEEALTMERGAHYYAAERAREERERRLELLWSSYPFAGGVSLSETSSVVSHREGFSMFPGDDEAGTEDLGIDDSVSISSQMLHSDHHFTRARERAASTASHQTAPPSAALLLEEAPALAPAAGGAAFQTLKSENLTLLAMLKSEQALRREAEEARARSEKAAKEAIAYHAKQALMLRKDTGKDAQRLSSVSGELVRARDEASEARRQAEVATAEAEALRAELKGLRAERDAALSESARLASLGKAEAEAMNRRWAARDAELGRERAARNDAEATADGFKKQVIALQSIIEQQKSQLTLLLEAQRTRQRSQPVIDEPRWLNELFSA